MSRQTILGLALGLSVLASSAARAEWHDIAGSEKGHLVVVEGKVRLARSGPPDSFEGWDLFAGGGERKIKVRSEDRWSGWYLAFDPQGKDPKVTLARESGPGTVWQLTRAKGFLSYTLQATRGKYKGWYLDAGKAETVVGKSGKKHTHYEAVLVKEPKKPLSFSITEVGR
jgi:hypothetical protein